MQNNSFNNATAHAKALGLEFEIIQHSDRSGKATDDAAEILNVDPSLILKMLILVQKRSGASIGVLLRGDEKIDNASLKAQLGTKHFRFARQEEVEHITGYRIGGIPPTAIAHCDHRFASDRLLLADDLYGSGGSEFCAMKIRSGEIAKLPDLQFAKVSIPDDG